MSEKVKFKPDEYHTVTPYMIVPNVSGLIDFIQQVFDGQEVRRTNLPSGQVMHAEMRIGDSMVMLADANENFQPVTAMLHLYLEDTDAVYKKALAAGATSLREPEDQFYGDRTAGVQDPFGNQWWLSTHFEDVSNEEIQRRAEIDR